LMFGWLLIYSIVSSAVVFINIRNDVQLYKFNLNVLNKTHLFNFVLCRSSDIYFSSIINFNMIENKMKTTKQHFEPVRIISIIRRQ